MLVGVSLALNVLREPVIQHVTSRPLGSLAPGYAATDRGYAVYALLVGDIGLVLMSVYMENPWLILGTIAIFVIFSAVVIRGEVITYRNLKR